MKLELIQDDPLNILASTKPVVENATNVFLNLNNIQSTAKLIAQRYEQGLSNTDMGFSLMADLAKDVQKVFIEDAVNFCFWAEKGKEKWQIQLEDGKLTEGGWYGLVNCFERGVKESAPILDAKYLSEITEDEAYNFFRGENDIEIPLLDKRTENLREAGKTLLKQFDGQFINLLEQSNFDAIGLAKLIIEYFPSYQDVSNLNDQDIYFYKRAQICPNDLQYILKSYGKSLSNMDKLTAFADYKLPQILRMFGIMEYSTELANKIDNYTELEHDSREEIEIRAATIWAVELLRQQVPTLTAGDIDNTIWLLNQSLQDKAKPYHRTKTIFY